MTRAGPVRREMANGGGIPPVPPHTGRGRRVARVLGIALAVLVVLVAGAVIAAAMLFDPNMLKPRLEAAVQRATGRTLAIAGPIGIDWFPSPTITAADVTLANRAGGSQPEMLRAARIETEVALAPLLQRRLQLERLVIVQPSLLLETDGNGVPNWRFTPERPDMAAAAPSAPAAPGGSSVPAPTVLAIKAVHLRDARITWRNGRSVRTTPVALSRLDATEATPDAPITATAELVYAGMTVQARAELGPLAKLMAGDASPWPVNLTLESGAARLGVTGAVRSVSPSGRYDLSVALAAPDLSSLSGPAGFALPPLHDVTAEARLTEADAGPSVADVSLHTGASDLGSLAAGLHLDALDASAPALDRPLAAKARGSYGGIAWTMGGTVAPYRAGEPIAVKDLSVVTPQFDAGGDVAVGLAAPYPVRATVSARKVDLDGLLLALKPPAPAAASGPAPNPASLPAPAPTPAPPSTPRFLISDRPLPLASLRRGDLDLTLRAAELVTGGVSYRDLAGHVTLRQGRLMAEKVSGVAPAGRLDGSLSVNAAADPPPVDLVLKAPALALKPLLAALGWPGMEGTADLDVDLHGAGQSPHAVAAGANGHVGLAVVDGQVDERALSALAGTVLRAAHLPDVLGAGGARVRCLAVAMQLQHGTGTLAPLVLDAGRVVVQGGGTVNLADEGLALRLRPVVRIGGPGVSVPVRVGGTFTAPNVGIDAEGTAEGAVGLALNGMLSRALPVPGLGAAAPAGDVCPAALAAARFGRGGPMPAQAPAPPQSGVPAAPVPGLTLPGTPGGKLPNAAQILRGLLH